MIRAARLQNAQDLTYQDGAGVRQEISGRFEERDGSIGFVFGDYDRSRQLVIDPQVVYSSYLGGGTVVVGEDVYDVSYDQPDSIAVDMTGSAYIAGQTCSIDFPTVNAFDSTLDCFDGFVSKVNPEGTGLVYSTYLGGSSSSWDPSYAPDSASGVAVDPAGRAVVVGDTAAVDFPVVNAVQPSNAGVLNAFVTKLSISGSSLEFSTYLGGSEADGASGVATDRDGNIVVVGGVYSANFPVVSAFQPLCNQDGMGCVSSGDAFVTKFDEFGSIVHSSFLGGYSTDTARGVATDGAGDIYVAGRTHSSDFPIANCFQCVQPSGPPPAVSSGFVTKIEADGSAIVYSSYLGSNGQDYADGVAVDTHGHAYVSGTTMEFGFPPFPIVNAFRPDRQSNIDAFISKVSLDGSSLVYSSFLGSAARAFVGVDSEGSAYVAGTTASLDFPLWNPFRSTKTGAANSHDGFITKIAPSGSTIVYSSYIGGSGFDEIRAIAIGPDDAVYLTGETMSADFEPIVGAFQPAPGCDTCTTGDFETGFVTKITSTDTIPGLAGTTINSTHGSISVYGANSGRLVRYQCCNTSDDWFVPVMPSRCEDGAGYKILYLPTEGHQARWYNDKPNWSEADCVSSPSGGLDSTLPPSNVISGYVKDATTAANIDGAVVYFFNSAGTFVGWTRSGYAGPGRYSKYLKASETYKVLVAAPPTHEDVFFDGAPGFFEATAVTSPATANFSLRAAGTVSGWVSQGGSLLPGAYVSAYPSCMCKSPKNAVTDATGHYSMKLATTAASGNYYRLRYIPPAGQTRWYSAATNWQSANDVPSPASNINQETPP